MSNYKHQKKHHGIAGLPAIFHQLVKGMKKKGNSHKKRAK